MKLLFPSRSISSSCSSSVSFDQNMHTRKSTTTRCLARVLRRILCSRELPTHPFDHMTEQNSETCEKNQVMEKIEEVVSAPIVARLMGLNTIPDSSPSSALRSRSTECHEHDFDLKEGKRQNLNPKSSVINMPVFIELENAEFIVFRFGKERGRKKAGLKGQNCNHQSGDLKQRNIMKYRAEGICNDKTFLEEKVKSKTRRKSEFDDSSDDTSPVSVLDFDQFTVDKQFSKTEEEPKTEDSDCENIACQSQRNDENLFGTCDGRENIEERAYGLGKRNSWRRSESEEAICRLIEEEVRESSWLASKSLNNDEIEEVAADFGIAVLDKLLDEILLQFR